MAADLDWASLLSQLRPGGKLCLVGVPRTPVSVSAALLVLNHVSLCGSLIGNRKDTQDMLTFAKLHNIKCVGVPAAALFAFHAHTGVRAQAGPSWSRCHSQWRVPPPQCRRSRTTQLGFAWCWWQTSSPRKPNRNSHVLQLQCIRIQLPVIVLRLLRRLDRRRAGTSSCTSSRTGSCSRS